VLVLSRKKGEQVVVNGNITVTVVDIKGDKIRLGFDAPKEMPVHRKEIQDHVDKGDVVKFNGKDSKQVKSGE